MIYRIGTTTPWPASAQGPRLVLDFAARYADHLNEPITIWSQRAKGARLKACRRIWPITCDHKVAGRYRRKSEKIR